MNSETEVLDVRLVGNQPAAEVIARRAEALAVAQARFLTLEARAQELQQIVDRRPVSVRRMNEPLTPENAAWREAREQLTVVAKELREARAAMDRERMLLAYGA